MASISRTSAGKWRARWREHPGANPRMRTFGRKIDAERYLVQVQHELATGTYVDPAARRVTFGGYAAGWVARQPWRPATATLVERSLRVHILPAFGDRPLLSIRRSDVERWAAGLDLAPSTVAVVRQHLGQVLSAAVEDGLLARSPATRAADTSAGR